MCMSKSTVNRAVVAYLIYRLVGVGQNVLKLFQYFDHLSNFPEQVVSLFLMLWRFRG